MPELRLMVSTRFNDEHILCKQYSIPIRYGNQNGLLYFSAAKMVETTDEGTWTDLALFIEFCLGKFPKLVFETSATGPPSRQL